MIYILHDVKSSQMLGGAALTCETLGSLPGAPDKTTVLTQREFSREIVAGSRIIMGRTETFNKDDLRWIMDTQAYVRMWFDYEFCGQQLAIHNCTVHCATRLPTYQYMVDRARLNIYSSPGQHAIHSRYLNVHNYVVWPRPVNTKLFWRQGRSERKNKYVTISGELRHKGFPEIKTLFPQLEIIQNTPQEEVARILKNTKYFVFLPIWYEPFGRAVAEAYLADCEMLVNHQKIGFYSYNWNYSDRAEVRARIDLARENFWKIVSW